MMLGLPPDGGAYSAEAQKSEETENLREEVHRFATRCPECNAPADTKMKLTDIPHFKEVVIMAMFCESCGHKTNEVKSGGGIEPKVSLWADTFRRIRLIYF